MACCYCPTNSAIYLFCNAGATQTKVFSINETTETVLSAINITSACIARDGCYSSLNSAIYIASDFAWSAGPNAFISTISKIDPYTNTETSTIQITGVSPNNAPYSICYCPSNNKIYLPIVGTTSPPNPLSAANNNRFVVLDPSDDSLTYLSTNFYNSIKTSNSSFAYCNLNNKIYVKYYTSLSSSITLAVLDPTNNTLVSAFTNTDIPLYYSNAICYNTNNEKIYTTDYSTSSIIIVDPQNNTVVDTISVSSSLPDNLCYNVVDNKIYGSIVGNAGISLDNRVIIFDPNTNQIIGTAIVKNYPPVGMCYSPDNGKLFVASNIYPPVYGAALNSIVNDYGINNISLGLKTLYKNTIGSSNIAIGFRSGYNILTNKNIAIGYSSDISATTSGVTQIDTGINSNNDTMQYRNNRIADANGLAIITGTNISINKSISGVTISSNSSTTSAITSGSYNISPNYQNYAFICNVSAGNAYLNVPAASASLNTEYNFKKIDNSINTITVSGALIDNSSSQVISNQYTNMSIISDGSNYWII